MKKAIIVAAVAAACVMPAYAQFGGLGGLVGGGKSAGGSSGGDVTPAVNEFVKDNAAIRETVAYSLVQIVAALGDKENIAKIKARSDSLAKTTDPKEAGSLQGAIIKDDAAVVQAALEGEHARDRMAKLSPEMQQKVARSIFAVGVASLRIPGMVDKGRKVMESVGSNPMNLGKVGPVKDGISMFAESAPKIAKIVTSGFALMKDVKVDAGAPTADAKLESDKNITFPES
jgi:hypothetical protein